MAVISNAPEPSITLHPQCVTLFDGAPSMIKLDFPGYKFYWGVTLSQRKGCLGDLGLEFWGFGKKVLIKTKDWAGAVLGSLSTPNVTGFSFSEGKRQQIKAKGVFLCCFGPFF